MWQICRINVDGGFFFLNPSISKWYIDKRLLTINLHSCTHCSESAKQHYIYPYRHVRIPSQIYPFWCICAFTQWQLLGIFVSKKYSWKILFLVQTSKKSKKVRSFFNLILKFLYFSWFLTRWHLKLRFGNKIFWTKISKSSHCGYLHKYCMTRWYVVQGLFKIGALKYYFRSKCKLTFWIFPMFLKSFFERDSPFIHIRVPPLLIFSCAATHGPYVFPPCHCCLTSKDQEGKDRRWQLLCYVSLIRACNKVL